MEVLGGFIESYGYIAIFVVLVLGIVGLPIPDEVLLTYVGYNIFIGRMTWSSSLSAALAGSIIGITISYYLGIKLGLPFLKRYGPKIHISEKRIDTASSYFSKYGSWFLTFGYYLPGIRHITAYTAGISRYKFGRFALFAYLGAIIWVLSFLLLGVLLGNKWTLVTTFEGFLHDKIIPVALVAIVLIAVFWYFRKRKKNLVK
ncbi:DedA family protein [Gracilibacillus sp. S3-1-1]|uniref:DedA family protein n=1 Tax=Gracilibacillus pellucidus TaxID=3095368 RepID=A0ACC6M2W3_9BACI|nr:DedA family protein [Gracilibacillus sp. S3-1-1]MDX8045291.1 DedA family protein [Gracilibacillus sp. S3-1-1]